MHDEINKFKKKRSNVGRYRLDHQATRFALKKGLLTIVLNVSDLQRNFCKRDLFSLFTHMLHLDPSVLVQLGPRRARLISVGRTNGAYS